MPGYKAPVDDVLFLLGDVFHVERYNNLPGFADATPDIVEAVLTEAAKFCEGVLTPLNRVGDKEGCRRHADGSVITPTGFKDAYRELTAGGWIGLAAPAEFGGQGLPVVLAQARRRIHVLGQYGVRHVSRPHPRSDRGAHLACARPSRRSAVPAKARFRRMVGDHEPDRAAMRHRFRIWSAPVPCRQTDGSYKITGTKIFISAGEHDLTDNIVHLVLARIEGAPAGTKGISLFIVPKFLPATAARSVRATPCAAARSKRKWASTATRPA